MPKKEHSTSRRNVARDHDGVIARLKSLQVFQSLPLLHFCVNVLRLAAEDAENSGKTKNAVDAVGENLRDER